MSAWQDPGIDSSESALELAKANAELNGVADRCQWQRNDVRPALEALAGQGNLFDAVILDLTIPGGMGGKETIERLLKIDPNWGQ